MNINDLPFIMIKCLLCTIIIEVLVALILKIRDKKDILNIVLVNIVTNPIVVSVPTLMLVKYGYNIQIITILILEVLTVIIEGFVYLKVLKYTKINPFIISFVLNASSYLMGKLINNI